jgi:hypothetical protein
MFLLVFVPLIYIFEKQQLTFLAKFKTTLIKSLHIFISFSFLLVPCLVSSLAYPIFAWDEKGLLSLCDYIDLCSI